MSNREGSLILIIILFGFSFGFSDESKNSDEIVYPMVKDNHRLNFDDYRNYYNDYPGVLTNPRYNRNRYVPDVDRVPLVKFYKPERNLEEDYYQRLRKDLYDRRSINEDLNYGKRRFAEEKFLKEIEENSDERKPRIVEYAIINRPSSNIENFYNEKEDYVNQNSDFSYNPITSSNNFPISGQRLFLQNKKRGVTSLTDEELEEIVNRALAVAKKKMIINEKGNTLIRNQFSSEYDNDRFDGAELNDPDAFSKLLIEEEKEIPIISIEKIDTEAIIAAGGGNDEDEDGSTIIPMDDDIVFMNAGEEIAENVASSSDSDNSNSDGMIVDYSTIETEGKEEKEEKGEEEEEEEEKIETGELQKAISGEEKTIDERIAESEIAVVDDKE